MQALTKNQENFCQALVNNASIANDTEAYRASYKTTTKNLASVNLDAHKVRHNPKVTQRINELKAINARKQGNKPTVESLTGELEQARQVGAETSNSGGMTSATMGKAKLNDLLPDSHTHVHHTGSIQHVFSKMTAEELRESLSETRQKLDNLLLIEPD